MSRGAGSETSQREVLVGSRAEALIVEGRVGCWSILSICLVDIVMAAQVW